VSKFRDEFERRPSGRFILEIFLKGELIEAIDEKNLIVVGSQGIHANLLGGIVANHSVTQIGFGTNLAAPAFGNTALTTPYIKAIDSVTFPASNEVQFNFSLGVGSGDSGAYGVAIGEFGLLTPLGVLYARKTRTASLNFNSDLSLRGSWAISF
jgi:hypothetical protein